MYPILNNEQYLARISGEDAELPEPLTIAEMYLKKILEKGIPAITIGSVTAGEEAGVTITGKPEAPVLNFVLPYNRLG